MTSSHFCTAERQFRTPLSYGAVRTPTAQWPATAAGACLLRPAGQGAVSYTHLDVYKRQRLLFLFSQSLEAEMPQI